MTAGTSSSATGCSASPARRCSSSRRCWVSSPCAVWTRWSSERTIGAMTVIPTATTTTPDGRTLTYCEWGDPSGAPVFSLHGTPGSRLTRHPDDDVYRRAGVHAITYDRAGYGRSTRLPGRAVAHAAADVSAIADALGI